MPNSQLPGWFRKKEHFFSVVCARICSSDEQTRQSSSMKCPQIYFRFHPLKHFVDCSMLKEARPLSLCPHWIHMNTDHPSARKNSIMTQYTRCSPRSICSPYHYLYEPRWPRNEIYIVSKSKFLMMLIDYKAGIYIWCHIWWSRCESKVWWIKVHFHKAFLSVSSVSVHCMCRLCFLLLQTDFCNAFLYCSLNTSPGISLIPKFSPRKYSGHASSQLSPRALHLGTCSHPFKVKSK